MTRKRWLLLAPATAFVVALAAVAFVQVRRHGDAALGGNGTGELALQLSAGLGLWVAGVGIGLRRCRLAAGPAHGGLRGSGLSGRAATAGEWRSAPVHDGVAGRFGIGGPRRSGCAVLRPSAPVETRRSCRHCGARNGRTLDGGSRHRDVRSPTGGMLRLSAQSPARVRLASSARGRRSPRSLRRRGKLLCARIAHPCALAQASPARAPHRGSRAAGSSGSGGGGNGCLRPRSATRHRHTRSADTRSLARGVPGAVRRRRGRRGGDRARATVEPPDRRHRDRRDAVPRGVTFHSCCERGDTTLSVAFPRGDGSAIDSDGRLVELQSRPGGDRGHARRRGGRLSSPRLRPRGHFRATRRSRARRRSGSRARVVEGQAASSARRAADVSRTNCGDRRRRTSAPRAESSRRRPATTDRAFGRAATDT